MENFILANCTDKGRVRPINEDSMVTFESPNGRVVTVCDGMGGQNGGEVASQLAVTVIQDILTDNTFATPEQAITNSMIAANQAILRRASREPELSGMGCTCVMCIVKNGKVYYGSVGDSRIYYVANGMIRQITKDQSYVQTLVDAGEITQEAAEHHQNKNEITNALGLEGMTPPVLGQMPITPEPGSVFLLCSDGLSGMVNNQAMLDTLSNHRMSLVDRARRLVDQANAAGGLDNITVQLIEFPAGGVSARNSRQGTASNSGGKRKGSVLLILLAVLLAAAAAVYFLFKPQPKPVKPQQPVTTIKQTTAPKQEVQTPRTVREERTITVAPKEVRKEKPQTRSRQTEPQKTKKENKKDLSQQVTGSSSGEDSKKKLGTPDNTVKKRVPEINYKNFTGEKQ